MGNLKHTILTFVKAQSTAGTATAIDFGLTFLLAKLLGVDDTLATFLGALSGGIANCIINYSWVFKQQGQKKRSVAWRYFVVWSVSILLNTFGTRYMIQFFHVDLVIAKPIIAALVAFFWNYQMQRTFVFHYHHEDAEQKDNQDNQENNVNYEL